MCARGAPTGVRGAAGGPRAGRGWCWLLCHGAPGLGVPAHPLPGLFSILIPAVPGSGAPLPGALGPSCPRSCCGQGGALGAGSSSCSWWQFKRIGSVPEWLWITRLELLQRRKQGMLAPSSCLCLAVPLHPSLGQRLCPSPGLSSASLQSPECCGGSQGPAQPMGAATLLGWGSWGWHQGQGSSAPSSARGYLWGADQAAWPLPECPGIKTFAEGMEKPQSIRGGEP